MATTSQNHTIDRDDPAQLEAGRGLVRQYLEEAHAVEAALVTTLQAHITMTPQGDYRRLLERHLGETRQQTRAIERRLDELGEGGNLISAATGLARTLVGQALALTKGPIDVLRGSGGEEKLVKNAKDECATEALEIATYDQLETAAEAVGDAKTARLAARHREQEERMLADLRALIPSLTQAAVLARAGGEPSYDLSTTGAADNVRELGGRAQQAGRSARSRAQGSGRAAAGRARQAGRGAAQRARTVPGEQAVEGEVRGATAGGDDLPIANYDDLNAGQIVSRLSDLSQLELRTVAAYERRHRNRRTILSRLENLEADEPWPGYDELTAEQVTQRLGDADEATAGRVREYEGRHQRRVSILEAAQRRLARA